MAEDRSKVLIIDDEKGIRDSLKILLSDVYDVETAAGGEEGLQIFKGSKPDCVILDILMPGISGIEVLKEIKHMDPLTPVIMLTAVAGAATAVEAMKNGANDYFNKPYDAEELKEVIAELIQTFKGDDRPAAGRATLKAVKGDFGAMVGRSGVMRELFDKIKQIAKTETAVLITGPSGTGKELVAKAIHENSFRSDKPFIPVNCAAIPETLIESELFGHEKGSFTNAIDQRIGQFELADTGTLFLDEIGELSLAVQVKLLRFLQEHEFYRVGRSKPVKVDVRIIAATNKNLEQAVKKKEFREDLYYRIHVIALKIPPLRARREDIPPLIDHFIGRFSPLYRGRRIKIEPEAAEILCRYPWPGNVRELENVIESLMALSPGDTIGVDDLPERIISKESRTLPETAGERGDPVPFEEAERQFETELIVKALKKTNYVQTRAARLLGISRRILKYKMDKLGISDKPPEQQN